MKHIRIDPPLAGNELFAVRLLRRYCASTELRLNALPAVVELAVELRRSAQTGIALHSVFQLTEATLGRPLVPKCCCSLFLSADEKAVLLLLAYGRSISGLSTIRSVPHGLPTVLSWAVRSANLFIDEPTHNISRLRECPFKR